MQALFAALHGKATQPLPGPPQTVLGACGGATTLLLHTFLITLLFAATRYFVCPRVLEKLPRQALSAKTRNTMLGYVAALPHHVWVGLLSLHALSSLAAGRPFPYDAFLTAPAITIAYLVSDFVLYAIPEWDVEFLLHHTFTMIMTVGFLLSPLAVLRWTASLTACELSSIPLAGSYFCLKVQAWRGSTAHTVLEYTFFAIFVITRALNLPCAVYALLVLHPQEAQGLGRAGTACLLALCAMQFYWLYKILIKLADKWVPQAPLDGEPLPAPAEAREGGESKNR